jgi:hypothetical protein
LRSGKFQQFVIQNSQTRNFCECRFQVREFDRLLNAIDTGGIFDRLLNAIDIGGIFDRLLKAIDIEGFFCR